MDEARKIELEAEIKIDASPERVWKAIIDEQLDWYPHTYGGERTKAIVVEPRVGGISYEDWGDGAGHYYSTVIHWDPPKAFGSRGILTGAITLEQWMSLEADGDQTVLKASTITFGPISEEMAEQIRFHGDLSKYSEQLKGWVERGETIKG